MKQHQKEKQKNIASNIAFEEKITMKKFDEALTNLKIKIKN